MSQAQGIPAPQFKLSDFTTESGIAFANSQFQQLWNEVNRVNGSAGKTALPAGIDVQGSTISGVGLPQSPADAISSAHAESKYSAAALAPQFEGGGAYAFKTYRALNSKSQNEHFSSFLNPILNTAPTCNGSTVSATAPSGGSVSVTTSASYHYFVDGEKITPYAQRTDTLTLPTSYSISSISRSGNIVTANTTAATGYSVGEFFAVNGVSDASYDGTFQVLTVAGSTITYNQNGANSSSSGGSLSVGSVYYHYIQGNSQTLAIAGPYPSDTQQSRLDINKDGSVLISTIVLNGSGLDTTQSAGGATPPAATGNARILTRL